MSNETQTTTAEITINPEVKNVMEGVICNHFQIEKHEIDYENTLESLGADDLDEVEIIMQLEKELNITIVDEEWNQLLTINDKIGYVSTLVEK